MLTIDTYLRPQSLDEAWELAQKKNSAVFGGMLWLRLGNCLGSRRIGTAIDLSDLGLATVEDTGDSWQIGAYTTLRTLETHPGLHETYGGVLAKTVSPIVGVQFRNLATVGGSVFGRFGFSDVLTTLLALNATVTLYKTGTIPLADFCNMGKTNDILTHVNIPKGTKAACYAQRNTATDFPVLNTCAAVHDNTLTVTVGARPLRACPYTYTIDHAVPTTEWATQIAEDVAEKCVFADNKRASAAYRKHLCQVLVRRAVNEVVQEGR